MQLQKYTYSDFKDMQFVYQPSQNVNNLFLSCWTIIWDIVSTTHPLCCMSPLFSRYNIYDSVLLQLLRRLKRHKYVSTMIKPFASNATQKQPVRETNTRTKKTLTLQKTSANDCTSCATETVRPTCNNTLYPYEYIYHPENKVYMCDHHTFQKHEKVMVPIDDHYVVAKFIDIQEDQ